MATKEQWEIFKYIHDEETARYHNLNTKGKVYLSLVTLYLGAIAFKANSWLPMLAGSGTGLLLFVFLVLCFLAAFCVTVIALGVYAYEGIADPEEIIEGLKKEPPTDEDFFDDRIVDVAVATNRNSKQNNKRAVLLFISSVLIVIGIVFHMALLAHQIQEVRKHGKKEESQKKEKKEEVGLRPAYEGEKKHTKGEKEQEKQKNEEIGSNLTASLVPTRCQCGFNCSNISVLLHKGRRCASLSF